jgi:hypothetical protein
MRRRTRHQRLVFFWESWSFLGVPPLPPPSEWLDRGGFAKMARKILSANSLQVKILITKSLAWLFASFSHSAFALAMIYFLPVQGKVGFHMAKAMAVDFLDLYGVGWCRPPALACIFQRLTRHFRAGLSSFRRFAAGAWFVAPRVFDTEFCNSCCEAQGCELPG